MIVGTIPADWIGTISHEVPRPQHATIIREPILSGGYCVGPVQIDIQQKARQRAVTDAG